MFQNCSVFIHNLDENIDYTIRSVYIYDPIIMHKQFNSNIDKNFTNALSIGGEIYKMSASIVS